ncbi:hypothetical protein [uncultured Tateyamaria sp.]|uniref:hypothetical protein n=1 Tax=uncultured Tateyamaria sp. TaxID=455651 RepID=UPI00262178B7|nr:hypothetical protein [uncultured Tateyamaria sp.]
MTTLHWPEDLPRPERNTWRKAPQEARQKRSNEHGPPAYRLRFSSAAQAVNLSMILTRREKQVFYRFFDQATSKGVLPFLMPDPTTDRITLRSSEGVALRRADGSPLLASAQWLCLFGDTLPTETVIGIEYRITFSLHVLP